MRARIAHRGESGYVLGVVLAAMVIGLSLITALLGLSFTTQRAAIVQQELARERRAADGALEAGLAGVLANSAAAADPCDASNVPPTVDMDVDGDSATQDKVALECQPILDPDPDADSQVVVVGDRSSWTWPSPAGPATGLVHTGDEPVRFAGDVEVKGTGAAHVLPDGPGMVVAGRFAQGEDCFAGSTEPGPNQIRTTEGGGPDCPSPSAALVTGQASNESPPVDQRDGAYVSAALAPCAPGTTTTFLPGRYLPGAVKALNDRFDDGCDATYVFSPGTYWFDGAYDPVFGTSVIAFADPGSSFVFGDPMSGTSPLSCDPDGGKAKVVLSGATTFRHTGGNVTICGSLTQARRTHSKPTLKLSSSNFGNSDKLFAKPADVTDLQQWPYAPGKLCIRDVPADCPQLTASVEANGGEPITSLKFRWHSFLYPNVNPVVVNAALIPPRALIKVKLTLSDGTTTCGNFGETQEWKDAGWTPAYGSELDLLSEFTAPDDTPCGFLLGQDQGIVDRATLQVAISHDPPCNPTPLQIFGGNRCTYRSLGFELVANEVELEATAPVELKAAGDSQRWISETCRSVWNYCTTTGRTATQFHQTGLSLPSGPVALGDDVASIVVKFSTAPDRTFRNGANRNAGGRMEIVAERGAETCSASRDGYTSSPRTYFVDLSDCLKLAAPGAGTTVADITSIDEVSVSFQPESIPWLGTAYGAEMPWLDHVRLSITSDTNHTVRPAQVTADGDGTRFRVYGDTTLPMIDLDVNWDGAGETTDESIFTGGLVVNSLLSEGATGAKVGVVCCGPLHPASQLVAYTEVDDATGAPAPDALARGVATLRFFPNANPLLPPTPMVTDWQLCSRAGCELNDALLQP